MLSRLCHGHRIYRGLVPSARCRTQLLVKPSSLCQILRNFAYNDPDSSSENRRRRTLKEQGMAPSGETAFDIGQGALAGGALLGLGALGFYGLGLSKEAGAIDHAVIWPQHVKQRIKDTYMYFGGSIAISAASAAAVFNSPNLLYALASGGFMTVAITLAVQIASMFAVMNMPYKKGFGAKQLGWMIFSGITGAVIAPVCLLGGPIIQRAALYTAGVVGGLSTIAVCAPSEKFLLMGAPLAIGFGIVFAASIGSMFLSPATALGAGLYSISLYGGLLLFSLFMLYDTQKIIHEAERYPLVAEHPFDPINASIGIYMDTINIFLRIAQILATIDNKKRKSNP